MTWVRLDDQFFDHPKMLVLSDAAFRLHLMAFGYSSRQLTDGLIPGALALDLTKSAKQKHLDELLTVAPGQDNALWVPDGPNYRIHDYLDYQPSRAKILDDRARTAERVRKHREARNAVTNANVQAVKQVPRPDPTRTTYVLGVSSTGTVDNPEEEPASAEVVEEAIATGRALLADKHPRKASA